ncbi:MAG: hypothetical protein AB1500_06105 [Bacillota bacterium]
MTSGSWQIAIPALGILIYLGVIAGYILFLVAVWRLMKAHESVAAALRALAQDHKPGPGDDARR